MIKSNKRAVLFCFMLINLIALSGCGLIEKFQRSALPQLISIEETPPMTTDSTQQEPSLTPTELPPAVTPSPTSPSPTATKIQSALTTSPFLRGMNIGNALEAPEPGLWGVTIQQSYFEVIAKAGFNAVRIPARFSAHTGSSPEFIIDPDFLETVDQAVEWGLNEDLIVIVDFHGFDELMKAPGEYDDQFLMIWNQLAEHYQAYPGTLWFDLLNEPSHNLNAETWNILIESSINIIRQTNPTRKILVGGVNYSTIDTLDFLNLPADSNLIGAFHFYLPFEFTHQGAAWVERSDNWLGTTWEGTESQKEMIRSALDDAMIWSHQTQTPIILGEFGAIKNSDPESRRRWISFVAREAEERSISWLYWGFCSDLGVYHCEASAWDQGILEALIEP